ncbi:hypothetical protein JTB14_007972 [Gonioctena quinquepunctata]|nr:hypothetical protein JTB14_007972 [Gonioctena quinquepunctata]
MVNRFTFYSDRCGDQNLNQFIAPMFMIAVQELENISMIDMECDSMHSAISTKLRRVGKASWPEDPKQIARSARRKEDKTYQVKNLSRENIQDNKLFMKQNRTNRKKEENSANVYWQKMCLMRFFRALNFKK